MGRSRTPGTWIALAFVLAVGLGGECRFSFSSKTSDRRRREPLPPPSPIVVPPGGAAVALPDGVRIAISDPGAGTAAIVVRGTGLPTGVVARFERPGPLAVHGDGAVLVGHAGGVSRLDPDAGVALALPFPPRPVTAIAVGGSRVGVLFADGSLHFAPSSPPGAEGLGFALALAGDAEGNWFVAGEDGGVLSLDPGGIVRVLGFLPGARPVLAAREGILLALVPDGGLHRFDVESPRFDSIRPAAYVNGFAWGPGGRSLLAWRGGGPVLRLDPATGACSSP